MALNGTNANLGPESDAWVRELERTIIALQGTIDRMQSEARGASR